MKPYWYEVQVAFSVDNETGMKPGPTISKQWASSRRKIGVTYRNTIHEYEKLTGWDLVVQLVQVFPYCTVVLNEVVL